MMPIPTHADQQVLMLYADIRSADALGGDMMRRNVDTRLQNIRGFNDLPDGAEAAMEAVRYQASALAVALRQFAQMGDLGGAVETVRAGAERAVDELANILQDATPNERARALGF